jgi:prepilin-type N-terminal cleavage/methylation domain-containing protein
MVKRGFTLVELLIVLAIVGLLASLVAPYGGKLLEGAQGRNEMIEARRLVTSIGTRAYVSGRSASVLLEGSRISWTFEGTNQRMREFPRLYFDRQALEINRNGIAVPSRVNITRLGRREVLDLDLIGANSE